jgi:hypothetical protein
MSITFKSFLKCLPFVTATKVPILLRGRHGIGKSSVVYQYGEDDKVNLQIIERRISQMSEGELIGLAKLYEDTKVTTWFPPDFLLEACNNPRILFFDEIDRGNSELRQALFQLADSRRVGAWKLHEDTLLFAASNSGENTAQYQVAEMDPAELDRWTCYDLEPSLEDWIDWGKKNNNISPLILEFILNNPKHLEHNGDFEPNKVYPSRRSWHRLNNSLVKGGLLSDENKNEPFLISLMTGFVGFEASISFADYLKNHTFLVSPKEVLGDGKIEKTKEFKINDHLSFLEKIEIEGYLKRKMTKKELSNFSNYFVTLPSEIAMKVLTDCGKETENPDIIEHNLKGLYESNQRQVESYVEKMLQEDNTIVEKLSNNENEGKKKDTSSGK